MIFQLGYLHVSERGKLETSLKVNGGPNSCRTKCLQGTAGTALFCKDAARLMVSAGSLFGMRNISVS